MAVTANGNGIIFADSSYQTTAFSSTTAYPGRGMEVFSANGAFTVPNGITKVKMSVFGGGAGGYAGTGSSGYSIAPGAGAAAIIMLTVSPGQIYDIVVGAGGNGDAGDNGSTKLRDAANGTSTTVTLRSNGTVVATAPGGIKGNPGTTVVGTVTTTGTIISQLSNTNNGSQYLIGGGGNGGGGVNYSRGGGGGLSGGGGGGGDPTIGGGSAGQSFYGSNGSPGTGGNAYYNGSSGNGGGSRGGLGGGGWVYNDPEGGPVPYIAGGGGGTGGVIFEY